MADTNLDKLKILLAELFMLDQADLDFGIYRVMNAKRAEVTRFLDHDLLPQVRTELEKISTGDRDGLEAEIKKAIQNAQALGMTAAQCETLDKVKNLRAQLAATVDVSALENEVLSDLANFFRRYYSGGDFLALRRYKAGVYAIPYEGEEVKLHWANADQYYIKTSEFLRDYTFKLADGKRVHFKLVEADTEADNKKSAAGQERRFILCANDPLLEADGELVIRFEYRPDADKRKQAELNTLAVQQIFASVGTVRCAVPAGASPLLGQRNFPEPPAEAGEARAGTAQRSVPTQSGPIPSPDAARGDGDGAARPSLPVWFAALARLAPTEKNPNRTLLEKHLGDYTARNSFDYFIHKDIGGFLRRELDFYIKNEIMHLDDIEAEDAPRVGQYLAKIKAIRAIARKIIDFLEQLENFQKKLWLKKKFVVETNYCVTLDRVAEALHPEIAANDAQWQEWEKLFAISEIKSDLFNQKKQNRDAKFLKANLFLVLDTKFFPAEFKEKLLADNKVLGGAATLDEATDGLLIHSENFNALNLLQARYRNGISCVFTDPPYNTGVDGFPYKDSYQHSSWLSLMENRLSILRPLLWDEGLLFMTIDFVEVSKLRMICDLVFGSENFLADIAWEKRYTRSNNAKRFYSLKDTVLAYRASTRLEILREGRSEKSKGNYSNPDNDPRGVWISSSYVNPATKAERLNLVYPIENPFTHKMVEHPTHAWKYDPDTHKKHLEDKRLYWGLDGGYEYPRLKSFLSEASDGMIPIDVWSYKETGTTDDGGHIHFIDGGDGGYAMAAQELKSQSQGQVHEEAVALARGPRREVHRQRRYLHSPSPW